MKHKNNKLIINFLLISLLFVSLFFISGQEGCDGSNTAKKTGVDFSLISRIDTLISGKILQPGETFYVGVKVENYDEKERQAEICIKDSLTDQYGGINTQGDCEQILLPAAEKQKKESTSLFGSSNQEQLVPGTKEVFFPKQGQYSYNGLPPMNQPSPSNLLITLKYDESTEATTTVYIPNQEQPSFAQEPSQIMVSLQKSIYAQGDGYNVNLDLSFTKNPGSKISLIGNSEEGENKTYFSAKLAGETLNCRTTNGQPIGNILEIKDNKLIKCSILKYQGAQRQDYDFIVSLLYSVTLQKNYGFSINSKEA